MAVPRKNLVYINTRLFKAYYDDKITFRKSKNLYDRNSNAPLFQLNIIRYVHKGIYYRKCVLDMYCLGRKWGTVTLTRKPFVRPLKRIKKKKRIG